MNTRELGNDGETRAGRVWAVSASRGLGIGWLCVCALALAGTLGEYWWWFDLASHFRVQYFVAACGLGVAAALFRCWKWSLASLAVAVGLGSTLLPLWTAVAPLPAGVERLRVLTVNVLSSNSQRELLRQVIEREKPDLVVALEFSPEWAESLRWMEGEYPHQCSEPQRGNFGMAVFSRHPLARTRVVNLGEGGPISIAVDIDLAGRPLTIWGVHPFPPVSREASAARNMHFTRIAELVRGDGAECVVVGDLNCTSWSPWFVRFTAETGLSDSRLGWGVQATWPAGPIWLRPLRIPIDHCLVSPSVAVAARHVTSAVGSDHLGVVVDLGWVDAAGEERREGAEKSR